MKRVVKGDELMLFIGGKALAFATNHVLTLSSETEDVQHKDSGVFSATEITKVNWEITSDNIYTETDSDDSYEMLRDAMLSMQKIDVVWGKAGNYSTEGNQNADESVTEEYWKPTNTGGNYYGGKCVISNLQLNAQSGSNATYSVTLQGSGPYHKITIQ